MEKVKGIAYWANVKTPNKRFNEDGIWQIDVEVNTEDQKRLKDLGISLIEKEDGKVIFRPKRDCKKKKTGENNQSPLVMDKFGKELLLEIGNGSEVEVAFTVFPYKRIKGNGADLAAVKVINLIPYNSEDVRDIFEFEEETDSKAENPFE